jgi:U32 family peptidase
MEPYIKPELLSPAGNLEKLKIACLYGADAVYIGGHRFGLRSGADNFSLEEINEASFHCKKHKVKLYVVLNAFLHNRDLEGLGDYVQYLEHVGVNALIISDLGVVCEARKYCSIPIHLSTQASCLNASAASVWKEHGVSRIITGRELTISEGGLLKKKSELEVEMFIHGAMCSAYSGNCSISNYTAGRDSNRGGCKQSCRFDYHYDSSTDTKPLMSSKDLNGIQTISAFFENKIDSLKIEGRMKSNLYVAASCKAYSNLINTYGKLSDIDYKKQQEISLQDLELYPNRGYSEASLIQPAGSDSIQTDAQASNKYKYAGTVIACDNEKTYIQLRNPVQSGEKLQLINLDGVNPKITLNKIANFKGEVLEKARQDQVIAIETEIEVQEGMVLSKC